MIYVDDVAIQADVPNPATGRVVHGPWFHLISDRIDPEELHLFAVKLGLRCSYFQPGIMIGCPEKHDPSGDHYDLTEGKRFQAIKLGAKPISAAELSIIAVRKRAVHRFGFLDIAVVVALLAEQEGTFALGFRGGRWTAAIEWGWEDPDSPMAAAAAHAVGETAQEAVFGALRKAGRV